MAKVKVEVLDAVVDGKGKGEQIQVEERSAKRLERIGYVRILEVEEKTQPKAKATESEKDTSASKKGSSSSSKKQSAKKK